MGIKVKLFFSYYHFWVGWHYDEVKTTLNICLVPMLVISIEFLFYYQIIGPYTMSVIGYCLGYDGKQDVLSEEPRSKFVKISRKQYELETGKVDYVYPN